MSGLKAALHSATAVSITFDTTVEGGRDGWTAPCYNAYLDRDLPMSLGTFDATINDKLNPPAPLVRVIETKSPVAWTSGDSYDYPYPPLTLVRCEPSAQTGPVHIILNKQVATGFHWHVYQADAVLADKTRHRVVAKLMSPALTQSDIDPETLTRHDRGAARKSRALTACAISHAANEDCLYRLRFEPRGLEGVVVPEWYGLYISKTFVNRPSKAPLLVSLVQDAGDEFTEQMWKGLPANVQDTLARHFEAVIAGGRIWVPWTSSQYLGIFGRGSLFAPDFDVGTLRIARHGGWIMADREPSEIDEEVTVEELKPIYDQLVAASLEQHTKVLPL